MSNQLTNKEDPAQVFGRLKDDSDYLATIDQSTLSDEDRNAYNELVASHQAEYTDNVALINKHLSKHALQQSGLAEDRQYRGHVAK